MSGWISMDFSQFPEYRKQYLVVTFSDEYFVAVLDSLDLNIWRDAHSGVEISDVSHYQEIQPPEEKI